MKPTPPAACSADPSTCASTTPSPNCASIANTPCRRRRGTARPSSTRAITSASREAIRPVLRKHRTLYFYNTQYEGGVCDRNIVCTGSTPAQTVARLVPEIMRRWGKRIYILAADYNYGQITARWVTKFARDGGGETVAADFFPLDATNFGPTIRKIQAEAPDMVVSVLVGGAHMSFYRQWAAAGMKPRIPLASTTFGVGNEHRVLSPEESEGIIACYGYFAELDTPANRSVPRPPRRRLRRARPPPSTNSPCAPTKASCCGRRRCAAPAASNEWP